MWEASLYWQPKAFVKRVFRHPLHYTKWFLMPKTNAIINIQNVVAIATLNQKVNLNAVVKGYPKSRISSGPVSRVSV